MNIDFMHLEGFTKHSDSEVTLPRRGLVLITGPNGGGKSSLPEAVATAFWGETLRGTSPWAGEGAVHVASDAVVATRRRIGNKTVLVWGTPTGNPGQYESMTKAQEALDKSIGPFDVWRRTHVFSSQDAAHFTMATDAERKRLLESVLELTRFDSALERCREDRRKAQQDSTAADLELRTLVMRLGSDKKALADAEATLASVTPPNVDLLVMKRDLDEAVRMAKAAEADIETRRRSVRELDSARYEHLHAGAGFEAQAQEIQRRLSALARADCDRCGQAIPQALRDDLKAQVDKQRAMGDRQKQEGATAAQRIVEQLKQAEEEIAELREEHEALREKAINIKAQMDEAMRLYNTHQTASRAVAGARARLQECETAIAQTTGRALVHAQELGVLSAAEVVLGMKGVRAHVLGTALEGVERVANGWLARIAGQGMRLHLKPYTEKKSGGVSDSISLEVEGAGGGYGYRAASGGERRRIDVALLFALAEVSAAARGRTPGTLWFDEVFDALDEDGTDAVRDALADLAKERAVVVITHSKALTERLDAALRLRVEGGTVKAA